LNQCDSLLVGGFSIGGAKSGHFFHYVNSHRRAYRSDSVSYLI